MHSVGQIVHHLVTLPLPGVVSNATAGKTRTCRPDEGFFRGSNVKENRLIHLECARGIASIAVVFHHFSLAFVPELKAAFWLGGLLYTPLYAVLNGDGAVNYFFMLSGYVFTLRFYRNYSGNALAISVIKRLPRLMIPAGGSILLGYLVLRYFPTLHQEAAAISGSSWLSKFGNSYLPAHHVPTLGDAARQTLVVFFRARDSYYNSNLWTMSNEFFGSLLVFGLIYVVMRLVPKSGRTITVIHFLGILLSAEFHHNFVPFLVGSYLAYLNSVGVTKIRMSSSGALMVSVVALACFSTDNWVVLTVGSLLVMAVLMGHEGISSIMSGKVGRFLGNLSFPLYLVHTLVILSLSSFIFATLSDLHFHHLSVLLLTMCITLTVSFLVAMPFMVLDRRWVAWLNEFTRTMVGNISMMIGRWALR